MTRRAIKKKYVTQRWRGEKYAYRDKFANPYQPNVHDSNNVEIRIISLRASISRGI